MAFAIYPDVQTAAALGKPAFAPIHLANGEVMSAFVPVADLHGPDPRSANATTTFIRVALSGPLVAADKQPRIELLAHDPVGGSPPAPLDPNTVISLSSAVALSDDVSVTPTLAYFSPPYDNNVYLLKLVIQSPDDVKFWIRITNTTGVDRDLVWVVADSDDDSRQPWIHMVPPAIVFTALVGQRLVQTLQVTNRGTGTTTITGFDPALEAPYGVTGLPATLTPNPNAFAPLTVSFGAPAESGDIQERVFGLVSDNKPDPGPFGPGHVDQVVLSAHTRFPVPSFAASPKQFAPKHGEIGRKVLLFGTNFNVMPVSVQFAGVATEVVSTSPSQITVTVPQMSPGSVPITVTTAGGVATSSDMFTLPPPPAFAASANQFTPQEGPPGATVTLSGSNFMPFAGELPTVRFGDTAAAAIIGSPTSTQITVAVPQIPPRTVTVSIETGGGPVVSSDQFTVFPAGGVRVPNVIGLNSGDAAKAITSAGLIIRTVLDFRGVTDVPPGAAERQDPPPGTVLIMNDPGSVVTVVLNVPFST